jgi:hypothetical protein
MPNTKKADEGEGRSKPDTSQTLPDTAICRARRSGFGDYVDCLVKAPAVCCHALKFGHGYLCLHPQSLDIVARTQAGQSG